MFLFRCLTFVRCCWLCCMDVHVCDLVHASFSPAKGRTNFDLRDQLMLDDNSQSVQTFSPRRSSTGRISPFPATASGKKRQNDTGYASSTSSGTPNSPSPKCTSTQHAPSIASPLPSTPYSFSPQPPPSPRLP